MYCILNIYPHTFRNKLVLAVTANYIPRICHLASYFFPESDKYVYRWRSLQEVEVKMTDQLMNILTKACLQNFSKSGKRVCNDVQMTVEPV